MKKGGIVNIVNRHNRPQCNSYEDFKQLKLENITCFDDYKLDFCDVVVKEIDTFAASIHGQQHFPNVFPSKQKQPHSYPASESKQKKHQYG